MASEGAEGQQPIRVVVRVRPATEAEKLHDARDAPDSPPAVTSAPGALAKCGMHSVRRELDALPAVFFSIPLQVQ